MKRKSTPVFWSLLVWALVLGGCAGYVPGHQAYWDAQVREMCAKDGGVTIYEQVKISKSEIERRILPIMADGKLDVAPIELAHPDAPIYAKRSVTYLRDVNPQVGRVEWSVIRRSDQKVVARLVSYGRSGGDFPTGVVHDSSFNCPDTKKMLLDQQELFVIEGGA